MKGLVALVAVISLTCMVAFADMPKVVDNSTSPYFPPLKRQVGHCAPFALVEYQFTYEYSRRTETNTLFSSHLANRINSGRPPNPFKVILFMIDTGSPIMGTDEPLYKLKFVEYFKKENNDNIPTMIQGSRIALAEGNILGMGCDPYTFRGQRIKDNPNTTLDDSEVGKNITYWSDTTPSVPSRRPTEHWITCIGYNDDLWADVNKNGVIDEGELGAFLFLDANTSRKSWIAYDAFYWVSPIEGAPTREDGKWTVMGSGGFYKLVLHEELPENTPPVITLQATPISGVAPLTILFNATITDPDGDNIDNCSWEFGE